MKKTLAKILAYVFAPIFILAIALGGGLTFAGQKAQQVSNDVAEENIKPYDWSQALASGFSHSEDNVYDVATSNVLINLTKISAEGASLARTTLDDDEPTNNMLFAELANGQIEIVVRAEGRDHYITASTDAEFVLGEQLAKKAGVSVCGTKIYTNSSRTASTMAKTTGGATITPEVAKVAYVQRGTVTFKDTTYTSSANTGRAIYIDGTGASTAPTVIIEHTTFRNYSVIYNTTIDPDDGTGHSENRYGSVIYNDYGNVIVRNNPSTNQKSLFEGCKAEIGGAIFNASTGTVTIEDGEFASCQTTNGGGAAITNAGTLVINGGTFDSNTSQSNGGVIANRDSGVVTINGGEFYDNTAATYGGIVHSRGEVIINEGSFYNNSAGYGGVISIYNGEVTINGGLFGDDGQSAVATNSSYSNRANTHGGVIYMQNSTLLNVNGGEFFYNYAGSNGGAIFANSSNCEVNITNDENPTLFQYNNASAGGAIYMGGGDLTIDGVAMKNNQAGSGGAIYSDCRFVMNGGLIRENQSTNNGGAVYMSGGTFTMNNGEIGGNTAISGGGIYIGSGILNANGGKIGYGWWRTRTHFEELGNTATNGSGGGVYVARGTANLNGVTMQYNSASSNGGAVASNNGYCSVNLGTNSDNKCTEIYNSSAGNYGGAIYIGGGSFGVDDGKIYSNEASNGGAIYSNVGFSMSNAQIYNNSAVYNGGAIYAYNISVSLTGCIIGNPDQDEYATEQDCSNYAGGNGGAIYIEYGSLTVRGYISYNYAGGNGGGIYAVRGANISAPAGSFISSNTCAGLGGGIYTTSGNCTLGGEITSNTAGSDGGGVYSDASTTVSGFIAYNISQNRGGGLYISNSITINDGAEIVSNEATSHGGGIYLTSAELTMNGGCIGDGYADSTATESAYSNYSGGNGGGIHATNASTINLYSGKISYNLAQNGGGIYSTRNTYMAPSNSTEFVVSYNLALTHGGGIYSSGSLVFDGKERTGSYMYNNYVFGNTARQNGGGIYNAGAMDIYGAVIYANRAEQNGGGIRSTGDATLHYGRLHSNSAVYGGGISVITNSFTIDGALFGYSKNKEEGQQNVADHFGGSIHCVANGTVIINGGSFLHDMALSGGIIYSNANVIINADVTMETTSTNAIYYAETSAQTSSLVFNASPTLECGSSSQIYLDKTRYITFGANLTQTYGIFKYQAQSVESDPENPKSYIGYSESQTYLDSACAHVYVTNVSSDNYALDPGSYKANYLTIVGLYTLYCDLGGSSSGQATLSTTSIKIPKNSIPQISYTVHEAGQDGYGSNIYYSVTITSSMYKLDGSGNLYHPSVTATVKSVSYYIMEELQMEGGGQYNEVPVNQGFRPFTGDCWVWFYIYHLSYEITYKSTQFGQSDITRTVYYKENFNTLPATYYEIDGYWVKNWSTNSSSLAGAYQNPGTTYQYTTKGNTTLYTRWEKRVYEITLSTNGRTASNESSRTKKVWEWHGQGFYLDAACTQLIDLSYISGTSLVTPTDSYLYFGGYYTSSTGGSQVFNYNGYLVSGLMISYFTSNATIYARWYERITLSLNGKTATNSPTSYIYYYDSGFYNGLTGNKMTSTSRPITAPQADGYVFLGYYSGGNAMGTQYIDYNGYCIRDPSSNFSNFSLYAAWGQINTRSNYFNGGSINSGNQVQSYIVYKWGQSASVTLTTYRSMKVLITVSYASDLGVQGSWYLNVNNSSASNNSTHTLAASSTIRLDISGTVAAHAYLNVYIIGCDKVSDMSVSDSTLSDSKGSTSLMNIDLDAAETAWLDDKHRKLNRVSTAIVTVDGPVDGLIV